MASLRFANTQPENACTHCQGTGIHGRVVVAEAVKIDASARAFIAAENIVGWETHLKAQGWQPIQAHAKTHVLTGLACPIVTESILSEKFYQPTPPQEPCDWSGCAIIGAALMSVMESVEHGWSQIQTKILQIRFSKEQQVEFLQDLIDSLPHVGTPMPVLMVLEKYAQGGRKVVAQQMMQNLKAGQPLAEAMVGWFDPLLVNATRVGEKEGVLVQSLKPVLKSMANNAAGIKQALGFFQYPVLLTVLVVFLLINFKTQLFPLILPLVDNDISRFPPALGALWSLTHTITDKGLLGLAIIGGLVWAFRWLLLSDVAVFKAWRYQVPIFKHYAQLNGAAFMQMYATLKRIHVLEMDIVHMAMGDASPYYYAHLERYQQRLNQGYDNMADVFDTGLLSAEMVDRLRLLAGSERYVEALEAAATKIVANTQRQINLLAKVIAGVWMLCVGMVVMVTFGGMFSISQLQAL